MPGPTARHSHYHSQNLSRKTGADLNPIKLQSSRFTVCRIHIPGGLATRHKIAFDTPTLLHFTVRDAISVCLSEVSQSRAEWGWSAKVRGGQSMSILYSFWWIFVCTHICSTLMPALRHAGNWLLFVQRSPSSHAAGWYRSRGRRRAMSCKRTRKANSVAQRTLQNLQTMIIRLFEPEFDSRTTWLYASEIAKLV